MAFAPPEGALACACARPNSELLVHRGADVALTDIEARQPPDGKGRLDKPAAKFPSGEEQTGRTVCGWSPGPPQRHWAMV
jgi:hypothetical protein